MGTFSMTLHLRTLTAAVCATVLIVSPGWAQTTPNPALLVGEKSGASLAIVDPATLEVVAHVPANENPHEVATDGTFAYISNSGADAITVIDLAAQQQADGIDLRPMGEIHGLVVAAGKLYFANETARTIGRYDPATREIDWVLGTGVPLAHMIAVSPDGSRIFATSMSAGAVAIIEEPPGASGGQTRGRRNEWTITVVPTGPRAEGLDLSPDGTELWVNNVGDSTISVIDLAAKREVATIEIPTSYSNRLKFTPDGRYVFVADLQGDEIVILDAQTRTQVERIDVGGGTEGLQMSPDGSRAFVAVSPAGKVAVIDIETLAVVGEITGLNNPDGMAWAERP
jgi:YVTN family beta-propeller protein